MKYIRHLYNIYNRSNNVKLVVKLVAKFRLRNMNIKDELKTDNSFNFDDDVLKI